MELLTIGEYSKKRKVSRQFIYEYIRKGKFEVVELPLFVEYNGIKINKGTKKFLLVQDSII